MEPRTPNRVEEEVAREEQCRTGSRCQEEKELGSPLSVTVEPPLTVELGSLDRLRFTKNALHFRWVLFRLMH